MTFDIRQVDLSKLNSMTKYPSILTYHALGDKGSIARLQARQLSAVEVTCQIKEACGLVRKP